MVILGLSNLDNSSAVILGDGDILAACEEERFTRKKHEKSFPINSICNCLKIAGIEISDVDNVAIGWIPYSGIAHRVISSLILTVRQQSWKRKASKGIGYFQTIKEQLLAGRILESNFGGKRLPVHYVNHHLAHASCACFLSPFEKAAYITLDGTGEYQTSTMGTYLNGHLQRLYQNKYPDSLGHLYSVFTSFLGFTPNSGEGKVMGLAAYGNPTYARKIANLIDFDKRSYHFILSPKYFDYSSSLLREFPPKFLDLFGDPRIPGEELNDRHRNIAASVQSVVEDIVIRMTDFLHKKTRLDNICLSGGVALNCVMNAKIKEKTSFENIYVPSAPSDAGVSLGAALYLFHKFNGHRPDIKNLAPLWGPEYEDQYKSFLLSKHVKFSIAPNPEQRAAELLSRGKIIGWFTGRMEFGPRALGSRSIIAPPFPEKMKEIINKRVKFRENFRPFAPIILKEDAPGWFETYNHSPNMSFAFRVGEEFRKKIPAVTHVDGRARLQTVDERMNPGLFHMLLHYKKLTGIPVLLNTSFNRKGEPIVCDLNDAWNCFRNSEIDYLFIDKYLIDHANL
ncbi:MAG: carbamoyltransferase C-terminal domain-containing protein [candidate division Zixibacteria bacterium]